MGKEIERKFPVKKGAWRTEDKGDLCRQGYLSTVKERVMRVRVIGSFWLTFSCHKILFSK